MSTRFAGKTIVVSGASSGLGRCLSLRLAAEGARLILFARREEKLRETASACMEQARYEPRIVCGDITRQQDCQRLVHEAERCEGLDYLLNCAGISMWMRFADMQELSPLEKLIRTNYLGTAQLIHGLLPLLQGRSGLICTISSIQGRLPVPYHSGYAASKHALEGFLSVLRLEQTGVDILIVYPSWLENTELRAHAIGRPPPALPADNHSTIPLETCTAQILDAMHRRRRELTVPTNYRFLPILRFLWPTLVEKVILRRAHRQQAATSPQV